MPNNQYNPRWLRFLVERGLTPEDANAMERGKRIALNAEFMCWRPAPRDLMEYLANIA